MAASAAAKNRAEEPDTHHLTENQSIAPIEPQEAPRDGEYGGI
jgi:hypothetical protein